VGPVGFEPTTRGLKGPGEPRPVMLILAHVRPRYLAECSEVGRVADQGGPGWSLRRLARSDGISDGILLYDLNPAVSSRLMNRDARAR